MRGNYFKREGDRLGKFVCSICGYVYDEALGNPEAGIAPGTQWQDVPNDWICPLCGAGKADFQQSQQSVQLQQPMQVQQAAAETADEMRELSIGELSALCSNLAKGCEKQQRATEAALFQELADYYHIRTAPGQVAELTDLLSLIGEDLNEAYPAANAIALREGDRGAQRALAWGEKVSRMLGSLLKRYESQQDKLLGQTNVFVCEACGFVYIGDEAPDVCPVCKVPKFKLEQIQRGQ